VQLGLRANDSKNGSKLSILPLRSMNPNCNPTKGEKNIVKSKCKNHLIDMLSDSEGFLFRRLQEYINYTNINNLLNVSIEFKEQKKLHFYWKLNQKNSKKYCSNNSKEQEDFRAKLGPLLVNKKVQLSLNLSSFDANRYIDVSTLGNVNTLTMGRYGISDISCINGIRDVSALGGVHILSISNCIDISDVSALGSVHILTISSCPGIEDVSALGNVHTLRLRDCHGIRDVSMLGNVNTLVIHSCDEIRDVSGLDNVPTLDIKKCRRLRDLYRFMNVTAAFNMTNKTSVALPDCHSGYGFAIGNVAAFDMANHDSIVSPGGVGFDINCGVRLLRTNLMESDVGPVKEQLAQSLFDHIPGADLDGAFSVIRTSNLSELSVPRTRLSSLVTNPNILEDIDDDDDELPALI
jgi:hypothetical protein